VKTSRLLLSALIVVAFSNNAVPQRSTKYPTPPSSMDSDNANSSPEPVTLPRRIDPAQIQKEADDLARTAQSIPSDVADVRKGMLPKDVIQKLKQIEKLSKQLRSQISQ
jgi:hypothetical protein